MGKIVEFPLLRAHRSVPAEEISAQIVIFPGVRREPHGEATERLACGQRGAAGQLRDDREH